MRIDPRLQEVDDCLYRLAIRALIFHEGKVLLVREKDAQWWGFPGGGVDYGENIMQAFCRELQEELGLVSTEFKTDYHIVHATVGIVVNGVPRANLFYRVDTPRECIRGGEDVLELGWFTPAELTPEILSRYVNPAVEEEFMQLIEAQAARQLLH